MPPLDVHVLHHHPDVIPQLEALAVAAAQEPLAGLVIFIIIVWQVHQAHPGAVGPAAGQEGMEVDQGLVLRV